MSVYYWGRGWLVNPEADPAGDVPVTVTAEQIRAAFILIVSDT